MLFLISSVYHCASGPENRHMKSLQVTGKSQHWSLKNNFNGTASLQGNHQELTPLCMRSLKSSLQTLENGKTSVLRCGFSQGSWASIPGWAVTTGPHWTSLWSSWCIGGQIWMIVKECPYLQVTFLLEPQTQSQARGKAPLGIPDWTVYWSP